MSDSQTTRKTQQHCTVPLSDRSRTATITSQWLLESSEDCAAAPIHHHNTLQTYICGEETFQAIAQDIRNAEESIDIVCWGFDPAMELVREARPWPRGDTWGDLLRLAAEGKLDARKKVQVRVLAWYDELADTLMPHDNLQGYATTFGWRSLLKRQPFNDRADQHKYAQPSQAASAQIQRAGLQAMRGGQFTPEDYQRLQALVSQPLDPEEVRRRRASYNLRWFGDVVSAKVEGLSLRVRQGLRKDVLDAMAAERSAGKLGAFEQIGLEFAATHHQKTIVIDYHGKRPRAYVLGLNSVTDYWDTKEHRFNDPRRGAPFEGDASDHSGGAGWDGVSADKRSLKPYQDYGCRIEGEAVASVYRNFVQGWNRARSPGPGGGANIGEQVDHHKPAAHLTAANKPPYSRVQVLRTFPEAGERSIERLYYQNIRWARHYIYIENQYFQHAAWARELKAQRKAYVQHLTDAQRKAVPTLHLIVVTPSAERKQMVPRTHDAVAELGHGDSIPNQDRMIRSELKRQAEYEKALEEHNRLTTLEAGFASPPIKPQLSAVTKSYIEAGGIRQAQQVRDELHGAARLRTLVASLWTYDEEWNLANTPIGRKVEAEQRGYQRALKEWQRRGVDAQSTPLVPPPDRSRELKQAQALHYREIYIHSKLMIVDDSMFTLGSANLNLRSFASDSEINIATDDPDKAKDLRQRVWSQHTKGQFDGGEPTDPRQMAKTFEKWEKQAKDNFDRQKEGRALTCFLVKFHDERTSTMRLA